LKERLKEAPAAQSFTSSPQFPKVIALGAGVWFLSVLYGNSQELGAFMTLLLPAVLFGVIVLVGFLFFGASASRVASDSDDLENRAEELEKSLAARFKDYGCETVGQARTVAERRQVLQAQLEAAPSGDPDALLNSDEDKAGIDALDAEQLRAKIKAMPAQLEKAESEWKERQTVHAKSRTAYEALLKDSPESRVDTLLQQMTRLAKHERLAGCDVPKKCHPEWIEQLKTASPIAAVVEEMGGFREALESLEHPGSEQVEQTRARFESLKAEIKVSRESLDVVKAEALATRGAGEARIAQIQRLVEKTAYLREEVASGLNLNQDTLPELRERATCARRQLEEQTEALYREVDVESKEQLEAKDEQRRSLKPLLKQDLDAPEDLSQLVACVDPDGQLESLSRLQISQRLAGLDKEKEEAEAAWKEQNQSYAAQREQFEALLKEDPRGSLIGAYEQLKELGQDSEAARVKLPDEFDPSVLEGPGSPDQQWRDLQSQREEQVGEFRLLLGAPEQASSDDPLRIAYDALRETREELEINSGQLHQSVGTMTAHEELYAELCRAQEELRDALRKQRQVEVEANGLVLLRNALLETQQVLEDELVSPLRERISERLDKLTHGAYRDIRISTDFTPQELLTPDEQSAPVEDLSFGTREQVAFLSRLCLADLLSETERQVVVFDDSLVHTDDKRMLVACELLHEAAQISQVIILTCHPERFETLLDEAHVVDLAMGSPAGAP
jgi:hypothetical protein